MVAPLSSRMFVFGHYGGKNTGDEAMLRAFVIELRKTKTFSVVVAGKQRQASESLKEISAEYFQFSIGRVFSAIRACDILVLGGGTHFHDDYSGMRYMRHMLYMSRIVTLCGIARFFGKEVYWIGIGIGPLDTKLGRFVTGVGLAWLDGCSLRDQESLATLQGIDSKVRVVRAFDLAALLSPEVDRRNERYILGISLTWAADRSSHEPALEEIIAKALGDGVLLANYAIRIFIIRGGEREDDRTISEALVLGLKKLLPDLNVEIVPYKENPQITLNLIAECTHFIATRFHSAVFAYVANCRLLLIEYHRKLNDLALEIGLDQEFVIKNAEVHDSEIVRRKVANFLRGESEQVLLPRVEAQKLARRNFDFFVKRGRDCKLLEQQVTQ